MKAVPAIKRGDGIHPKHVTATKQPPANAAVRPHTHAENVFMLIAPYLSWCGRIRGGGYIGHCLNAGTKPIAIHNHAWRPAAPADAEPLFVSRCVAAE